MFLMIVETEKRGESRFTRNLRGGAKGRTPVSQQKFMNPELIWRSTFDE